MKRRDLRLAGRHGPAPSLHPRARGGWSQLVRRRIWPALPTFAALLREVEYSRVISAKSLWVFRGCFTGSPSRTSPGLLRCMTSAKMYQYRRHVHVTPGEESVDLREVFERSVLLNVRDGVKVVSGDRLFPGVIRPTVDTFFLLDSLEAFLAQEARRAEYTTALEVGVGCGLIAKTLPLMLPNLRVLHAIDIDPMAVRCAFANLAEHASDGTTASESSGSYRCRIRRPLRGDTIDVAIWSADATKRLGPSYDLVVCNPPYIPRAPGGSQKPERWFAGTEVISALVRRDRLGPHGRLALSVSEGMAGDLVRRRVHDDRLRILFSRSTEVPFKVWEVRDDGARLRVLLEHGQVRERRGRLFHTLRSFLIGPPGGV